METTARFCRVDTNDGGGGSHRDPCVRACRNAARTKDQWPFFDCTRIGGTGPRSHFVDFAEQTSDGSPCKAFYVRSHVNDEPDARIFAFASRQPGDAFAGGAKDCAFLLPVPCGKEAGSRDLWDVCASTGCCGNTIVDDRRGTRRLCRAGSLEKCRHCTVSVQSRERNSVAACNCTCAARCDGTAFPSLPR